MYMFNVFLLNLNLFCFYRQLPSSFTNMFFSIYSSFGARLLLFIVRGLFTSLDNLLDFHDEMLLVMLIFFKISVHQIEY